jgi:hypothetical protein
MITMRPLSIVLALLLAVALPAGAQSTQCSTDTLDYRGMRRVLDELTSTVTVAAASKTSASATSSPAQSAAAATPPYKLLTVTTACSRLRTAVAAQEAAHSQGVNLQTVHWTFVDLGSSYGVLLATKLAPSLGLNVGQRSPLYLFTKDSSPRFLKILYI